MQPQNFYTRLRDASTCGKHESTHADAVRPINKTGTVRVDLTKE